MFDPVAQQRGITYEEVLLKIDGVSMEFGTPGSPDHSKVLHDVTAEVRNIIRPGHTQGQVVGFLGPSGRGKTQLFRIMAGLQEPTSGTVRINRDGKLVPVSPGLVGVVDQHCTLLDHLTVGKMLTMAARKGGYKGADAVKRAREILGRFDLLKRWDYYPGQLSGGQRQRVAIAEQILCSQRFLLMDEPFSGLDPTMKDEACRLISETAALDELFTIIVITHDMRSAIAVSDRLWFLGYGVGPDGKRQEVSTIRYEINLIERGLAWHPTVDDHPRFADTMRDARDHFKTL